MQCLYSNETIHFDELILLQQLYMIRPLHTKHNRCMTPQPFLFELPIKMKLQHAAAIYFVAQAIAGMVWWIAISRDLTVAEMFFPVAYANHDMTTFRLADLTWFVGGSGLAGILIWKQSRLAYPVAWMVVGAVGYATFCTFGLLLNGGRLLAIGVMVVSLIGTFIFATQAHTMKHASPPSP